MEMLERILKKCPDTIFLGHGPGFWSYISGDDKQGELYPEGDIIPGGLVPEFLRKYPNLYCDMSANSCKVALSRNKSFTKEFCDEFQDRILYARDCFHNEHQELIEDLNLTQKVKDKIYSANAVCLVPDSNREI